LTLESLGWNDEFAEAFAPYGEQGLVPARVAVQHRGGYVVLTEDGELEAEAARRQVRSGELAGVGDWVALRVLPEGQAIVEAVLPRRTAFTRKETMDRTGEQIVAANVDTVFLVSALGHDLNLRRLERYLTAAWDSGAEPVIVLTKADLHPDAAPEAVADVEAIAFGVPVHAVSNVTGEGLGALDPYLGPGRTVALLGSSGVGKSTLVNSLLGEERMATAAVREDDERGRHTTSHRELVPLPRGALLLDTPGMRELQLYADEEALDTAFADIAELAAECRFSDCTHDHEPGCAVRAALEDGRLEPERWESYRKLQAEIRALEIRQDKRLRSEERKKWRQFSRSMRKAQY
jgi:ribosome biogenesis GTPase / thiamine phosphate phosphatase